ncbi:hypothetical protein EYF80_057863 [Liparis tanakae]|uniref:Uncharacterized protein n=1 Tax=Liparis tanakae TaxID=230148 RepID=A0A4Z2ET72_9TELE|nr:hypothetical protein EYF80_057863 [Liparis tanakae]
MEGRREEQLERRKRFIHLSLSPTALAHAEEQDSLNNTQHNGPPRKCENNVEMAFRKDAASAVRWQLPSVSALGYFPALCKCDWLADANSHSTEETSHSSGVPDSDGSSITRAANTHYTPITDHHSNSGSGTQCRGGGRRRGAAAHRLRARFYTRNNFCSCVEDATQHATHAKM